LKLKLNKEEGAPSSGLVILYQMLCDYFFYKPIYLKDTKQLTWSLGEGFIYTLKPLIVSHAEKTSCWVLDGHSDLFSGPPLFGMEALPTVL